MILILRAVLEQHTVQLLNVIFSRGDGLVTIDDHVHSVGIARHFLLIPASKGLRLQPGQELLHLHVAEFRTLDAFGRFHTLNRGNPPQAGQPFRGEGFNDLPAAFELVDVRDELQNFRRDRDVLDLVHGCNIQSYPFIANS